MLIVIGSKIRGILYNIMKNSGTETPGELAYAAYAEHLQTLGVEVDEPDFHSLSEDLKTMWNKVALAPSRPLAEKLFKARFAIARLLVTYRDRLQGDWYEATAKECGIALDAIGFIESDYRGSTTSEDRMRQKIEQIAKGECE